MAGTTMTSHGSDNSNAAMTGRRPSVWFVGDTRHADFRDVIKLLRHDSQFIAWSTICCEVMHEAESATPPELIFLAQVRPGEIALSQIEPLRRAFPLAGIVALLGSWCEGHLRTGRPLPGAERLYWHEFPVWWARQMALCAACRCPDWARPSAVDKAGRIGSSGAALARARQGGLIVLNSQRWETADALGDALHSAGYSTVYQASGRAFPQIRGAVAGVWDGGQLDDREASLLGSFCQRLARDSAPVVAILDFPRRDTLERATNLGAAAAIGKPWNNAELVTTIQHANAIDPPVAGPIELTRLPLRSA